MIRLARPDDVNAIARVHVEAWRRAYRDYLPAASLDNASVERRTRMWARILSLRAHDVAVAELQTEVQTRVVGFVSVATSQHHHGVPATGEITAIYVAPPHWRQGHGLQLMNWAWASARQRGWREMTLWVFKRNEQARAFYESLHWVVGGAERAEVFEGEILEELQYVRRSET